MNNDVYAPKLVSTIPDSKLQDGVTRWVLSSSESDPKTYKKILKIIRKNGFRIEDRPVYGKVVDDVALLPYRGDKIPVITRSVESRNKNMPWILAREYGRAQYMKAPVIKRLHQISPHLRNASVLLATLSIIKKSPKLALYGALAGGLHAASRLNSELVSAVKADKIMREVTGASESLPKEITRPLVVAGIASIPALANLILRWKYRV